VHFCLGKDWEYDDNIFISESESLVELWMLVDGLGMPRLRNTALKAIHDMSEKWNLIGHTVFN